METFLKTVFFIFLGLFIVVSFNRIITAQPAKTAPQQNIKGAAAAFCKEKIQLALKAPATAKFPYLDDFNVSQNHDDYHVDSYLDAQNSFGALLRSNFSCEIKHNGDYFNLQLMKLDGETVFDTRL